MRAPTGWYPIIALFPTIIFWILMVQGKITEVDTLTVQLGATPAKPISEPPPSSPIFMPDALPAVTFPIYPGLGQAQEYAGLHTLWLGYCTPTFYIKINNIWNNVNDYKMFSVEANITSKKLQNTALTSSKWYSTFPCPYQSLQRNDSTDTHVHNYWYFCCFMYYNKTCQWQCLKRSQ